MKYLIYGHNGWIGSQVMKLLEEIPDIQILCGSRAENPEQVEEDILKHVPDRILAFIGRTHGKIGSKNFPTIDYLEQPGKLVENVRDNLFSPMVLAILASKHKIHFTYFSTGCIFTYSDEHPFGQEVNGFTEDSKPNYFDSGYSVVKGFTDQLMHLYDDYVLNVRIRMPITGEQHPRNFITKITKYEKICSVPNSMTVLDDLLPILLDMIKKGTTGTINLTNPGLITHNEILQMYKEIVDPTFKWVNFSIEDQSKILAAGRSNNYLDTSKLEQLYPKYCISVMLFVYV